MNDRHPSETDLALLAGGDCCPWLTFSLHRHLARCFRQRAQTIRQAALREAVLEPIAAVFARELREGAGPEGDIGDALVFDQGRDDVSRLGGLLG